MGNSVLDGCGKYSEDLNEISEKILETKRFNGEQITELDVINVNDEIFQAYQTILSTLRDGNSISRAVQNMKNNIEHGGIISDLKSIAVSAIQKTIQEQSISVNHENKVEDMLVGVVVGNEIADYIEPKSLDKIFDSQFLEDMDSTLEKAKEGDIDATAELRTIEAATKFLGKNPKLEGNLGRAALVYMLRLSEIGSPMSKKILEQMASQYKGYFDVFEKNEDGTEVISPEKIRTTLEKEISSEKMKNMDFKKINIRTAERAIKENVYTSEDSPQAVMEIVERVKDDVAIFNTKKLIEVCKKKENGMIEIEGISEKYPELVRKVLKQEIEICNKIQESGKGIKAFSGHEENVMILSETVKKVRNMESKENCLNNLNFKEKDSNIVNERREEMTLLNIDDDDERG